MPHLRLAALVALASLTACGEGDAPVELYEDEELDWAAQPVTCSPVVNVYPVRGRHNHGYDSQAGNSALWTCNADRSNSDWIAPGSNQHVGNDIWAARGTPVAATADGTITTSGYNGSGPGWRIVLRDSCGWYHYFYHLDRLAPGTGVGARVSAGQTIGYVGSSGATSNGVVHLHYSLGRVGSWTPSQMVNPHPYLRAVESNVCGTASPPPLAQAAVEYQVLQGDLNGDGLQDLVTASKNAKWGWSGWMAVDLSTGSGFTSTTWAAATHAHMRNGGSSSDYRVLGGDFNGDGRLDLVTLSPNALGAWAGNVGVELSNGSGFDFQWWPASTPVHMRNVAPGFRYQVLTGDFNGDGKTDLATVSPNAPWGWEGFVAIELSTGTGFTSVTWNAGLPQHMRGGGVSSDYRVFAADFNGDGKTDLASVSPNALWGWAGFIAVELSTGSGFSSAPWSAASPQHLRNGGSGSDYRIFANDVNGDGKADLTFVSPNAAGAWAGNIGVELSSGNGFGFQWWPASTPVHMRNVAPGFRYQVLTGDFNGDGKSDLATVSPNAPWGWEGFAAMELSSGAGFGSSTWSCGLPQHMRGGGGGADYRIFAGNFGGDGKADLATLSPDALWGWAGFVAMEVSSGAGFGSSTWGSTTPQHMRNGR
ncbi:MAG: VCBS repeat domain-containing M23 family metallopeptidase [Myxococcaceae bacterium]|nr:VCBS repeat domain-containing M23 family metallopeptidase [Myxococcaceae bacterium]